MANKLNNIPEKLGQRHHLKVVALVVLAVLMTLVFIVWWSSRQETEDNKTKDDESAELETEPILGVDAYKMPKSDPVTLRIPKIDLATKFSEPLGLTEDQAPEVPDDYETVGYYQYGPTPGELGPAVVLGHVDSLDGPAVFFYLGQLEKGDSIFVDRADGSTAEFVVTDMERPAQSRFPTEKVYGSIDHAGLRLITCTGIYDRGRSQYTHNLIVYAELKEPEEVTE